MLTSISKYFIYYTGFNQSKKCSLLFQSISSTMQDSTDQKNNAIPGYG